MRISWRHRIRSERSVVNGNGGFFPKYFSSVFNETEKLEAPKFQLSDHFKKMSPEIGNLAVFWKQSFTNYGEKNSQDFMRRKVEGSNPGPPPMFLRIRSEDISRLLQHAVQSVFFTIFLLNLPEGTCLRPLYWKNRWMDRKHRTKRD